MESYSTHPVRTYIPFYSVIYKTDCRASLLLSGIELTEKVTSRHGNHWVNKTNCGSVHVLC